MTLIQGTNILLMGHKMTQSTKLHIYGTADGICANSDGDYHNSELSHLG